jgi:hypothetical protein
MRLWSFHPQYLDAKGLVAVWREALLARAVVQGKTHGYTRHPQLERFTACGNAAGALESYLRELLTEAVKRGYHFNAAKLSNQYGFNGRLPISEGQLAYELMHLKKKLLIRAPLQFKSIKTVVIPLPHPLFFMIDGPVASWEKV